MIPAIWSLWTVSYASILVSGGLPPRKVQASLSLKDSDVSSGFWTAKEQSMKLPKAMDLQKEAEKAQKNLIDAIHQAQLTEAKRIAARSLIRLNAGFSSAFSKIAMMLDAGVHQAMPLDITLKSDQVNEALAKRTSATHSITHAMAYLANYTLNYTLTASATVFNCVEAVPQGEPKFTWASEPPLEDDEAFSFDLPAKSEKDQAEAVPFEPMPVPFAMAGQTIDAKDAKDAKAKCEQCPQCAECLEAASDTMQDSAVDAIEVALEAEVKRMGATVFQKDPKAEVEFLCKFNKYSTENHYRAVNPLVHPAEHEQPISSDKTASFRSFLQRMHANKAEECPQQPPSIASLDDASHVAQQEAIQKIFMAQYHEIVRSVNRGLVRLQAATDAEGWHTESTQMKSFDNKKWNGEFQKFLLANPIKRWAWNYKPDKKEKK
eukprot:gnl/MRDRNA2_/MRDRNA2_97600_c0_seq1.p1 gnl/MRDRNA2_/MRDRNA2_97600_c0~~gnl/MRDRNA2_/MRDRNA2_97600_c0_seq1.p1  ORF type:complete len:434 (+),score=110.51 gnl/MRDRNA2_/MRDRNA2_97600_c0_seq1:152-1453(+)